MSIRVVDVPRLQKGADPPPVVADIGELSRRSRLALTGDDDLADPAPMLAVALAEQGYRRKLVLVAYDAARPVGALWLGLPLKDNLTSAHGEVLVDPEAAPGVILPALWDHARRRLSQEGRSVVQLVSLHRSTTDGEHRAPRTGVGRLPVDPMTTALEGLGFVLEQVEQHRVLEVAPALGVAEVAGPRAREVAGTAYRTLSWVGRTPPEHLDGLAALLARLSTDAPLGELQVELESWDAQRVAEHERMGAEMGRELVTTVAQHVATGELVAFTQLDRPLDKPVMAFQAGTLVVREHRGHRLGMLVKAVNLHQLAELAPSVRRVHTWNAGENAHMLAINVALGFQERGAGGTWQLTGV
ncbi:hypothetical protein [Ornithinimicrobium pekingense]|uniref:GNAT family N-acetyltransferase n=1 Tax=Ornithinimicrobium pekingense TaxID=384677 RepID=A0ABQ2F913_9MICO|nr:hypothetical protein [Ornithinimicrobium pekingense]GGK70595.1 GNAT family N-acetyltransferase [Ornithinimicrobium pekingense]